MYLEKVLHHGEKKIHTVDITILPEEVTDNNSILSDVINYCIRFLKERLPEIETAALGNEAGMIGAASLL